MYTFRIDKHLSIYRNKICESKFMECSFPIYQHWSRNDTVERHYDTIQYTTLKHENDKSGDKLDFWINKKSIFPAYLWTLALFVDHFREN